MKRALGLCVFAALVVGGCKEPPRDPSQWPLRASELAERPIERGAPVYGRTCIACHGVDGRGNGGTTGADLTRQDGPRTLSDDALRTIVLDGRRGAIGVMPAHRSMLTSAEVDDVVAYVRTNFAPLAAPPADVAPAADVAEAVR